MEISENIGYRDQEILIRSLVVYISENTKKSKTIILSIARNVIDEWTKENNLSIKELTKHDQEKRDKAFDIMLERTLNKLQEMVTELHVRSRLKIYKDCHSIYEYWKKNWKEVKEINSNFVDEIDEIINKDSTSIL